MSVNQILQSRLKSTLLQQTQNAKFNILINTNLHNYPALIKQKQKLQQRDNGKKSHLQKITYQNNLKSLKQIPKNELKIQINMQNKLNSLKKRSYSQRRLISPFINQQNSKHQNNLKKDDNRKLQRNSILPQPSITRRPRIISSASSSKIHSTDKNNFLQLKIQKQPINTKQHNKKPHDKQLGHQQRNYNRNSTIDNKTYKQIQPVSHMQQLNSQSALKGRKFVTPVKSDRNGYSGTAFSIDPALTHKALQTKLYGLTSNEKNSGSQIVFLHQSQNKKPSITLSKQQKLAAHNALHTSINNSLVLFIKDNLLIENNVDYNRFLQIIEKERQKSLLISQNLQQRIQQIKNFAFRYQIQSSTIQVNKILEFENKRVVSNWNLLNLFNNWKHILDLVKIEGKIIPGVDFYHPNSKKGMQKAALKITGFFRLIKQRKARKNMASLMKKVIKIQDYWRRALIVKRHQQLVLEKTQYKIKQHSMLQQKFIANYNIIKTSRKIQLHINSLNFQQFKRITLQNKSQYQNIQLSRIFKGLQNPDTFIIYVTPIQISDSVIKYYQRLFKIATKNENSLKEKVYFIYPQNTQKLQKLSELTTLSCLLYSPKALKRIKSLIKSISSADNAYIVPSFPSIQYVNLSYQLKIPIFSSSLTQSKLFSTKIGFRDIIIPIIQKQKQKNNTPPFKLLKSISSIFSQKQLINTLALLIYKNQEIKRWYLKIDDQFDSRGVAYFNVNSINLFKKINNQENQDVLGDIINDEKELIKIIVGELKQKFKQRLKILHKNIYPTYHQFITHFLTRGGVIEASPTVEYSKIKPMIISFVIQPNGDFQILGTYKKLQLNSKSICNAVQYPANIPNVDIQKIVRHLYRRLYIKMKFFGYFNVDLLVQDSTKNYANTQQKKFTTEFGSIPYIIGLNFYLNLQTSVLFLVKQLAKVKYDKDTNTFVKLKIDNKQNINYDAQSLQSSKISKAQFQQQENQSESNNEDRNYKLESQKQTLSVSGKTQIDEQTNKHSLHVKFLYCPKIILPNLQNMAQFFKKCKYQNISFDLKNLLGTFFLPLDQLQYQNIGFIVCEKNVKLFNKQLMKLLDFLSKNYRKQNGKTDLNIKSNNKGSVGLKKENDQVGLLRGVVLSEIHKTEQYKKQKIKSMKNNQVFDNNLQIF